MASAAQPSVPSGLFAGANLCLPGQPAACRPADPALPDFFSLMDLLFAGFAAPVESSGEQVAQSLADTPGGTVPATTAAPAAHGSRRPAALVTGAAVAARQPARPAAALVLPAGIPPAAAPTGPTPEAGQFTAARLEPISAASVPVTPTAAGSDQAAISTVPDAPIAGPSVKPGHARAAICSPYPATPNYATIPPVATAPAIEPDIISGPGLGSAAPDVDGQTAVVTDAATPDAAVPVLPTPSLPCPAVPRFHEPAASRAARRASIARNADGAMAESPATAAPSVSLPQAAPSLVMPAPRDRGVKLSQGPVARVQTSTADAPVKAEALPPATGMNHSSEVPPAARQQVLSSPHPAVPPSVPSDLCQPSRQGIPESLQPASVQETGTNAIPFELAFSLRLRPLPSADAKLSPASAAAVRSDGPAANVPLLRPDVPQGVSEAPAAEASSTPGSAEHADTTLTLPVRQQRPTYADAVGPPVPTPGHVAALPATELGRSPEREIQPDTPRSVPEFRPPSAIEPLPHDPVKPSAPVRSLELQLDSNQGRVAVRLADRAGDVKVDVRAADPHLASTLRGELPALAARMEQTGYRAEMWRPSASAVPDRMRVIESTASPGDFQNPSQGGRDHGQEQERHGWTEPKQHSQRKNNGKDFQWLFTSIR